MSMCTTKDTFGKVGRGQVQCTFNRELETLRVPLSLHLHKLHPTAFSDSMSATVLRLQKFRWRKTQTSYLYMEMTRFSDSPGSVMMMMVPVIVLSEKLG